MERKQLEVLIGSTLREITLTGILKGLVDGSSFKRGKVRDIFDLGDHLLITTTDRISAFDRVLTTIPCKGEVLNRLSLFWFGATKDLARNHLVEEVSGRSVLVKKCRQVPVEVVVRGYLTGSAWRDYQAGKAVSGIHLPAGMKFNQSFDEPIITPSTKEEGGAHDVAISTKEIVERGIVEKGLWQEIERTAKRLYQRGSERAQERGLILVDTKYEFGLDGDAVVLVDEIHTPDSSRYWHADSYDELYASGQRQRELDKEYLRNWLMEHGFRGDGPAPHIPEEIRVEVAWRYIRAFETITGQSFTVRGLDAESEGLRIAEVVRRYS